MSESRTIEVVRALAATWNSGRLARVDELFAGDARFEDVAFGVVRNGLDEIRALFQTTWEGIPDLPATGRSLEIHGVSVLQVREGEITRQRDDYDRASFLEQLGALDLG